MGLLKAAAGAIGSTLHDQWKEAIRCEDLGNDILMKKVTTPNGVISNGSTVIVAPGQCAILYDNGRIIDASAEDGMYTFDTSSTPSLFAGQFGGMFKEMWQRFTYNGASAKEQAVYFINIKEIINNKFGTPAPVPYKDWGHPIMNARTQSFIAMSVNVRCFGKYTFKVSDPFAFMAFAGLQNEYTKQDLTEQMKSEVIGSFQNVMSSLGGEHKIEALDLPNQTDEIKKIMDENVFDEPIRKRGISLVSFVVESVTFDEKSQEKIDQYEIGGDAYQQQGTLTGAYASAVKDAANNPNGAMNGFMGVGMMNMASNGMAGAAAANAWNNSDAKVDPSKANVQPEAKQPATEKNEADGWECPNCHKISKGNFCTECGTKKPEEQKNAKKFCPECGKEVRPGANFCPECGKKLN